AGCPRGRRGGSWRTSGAQLEAGGAPLGDAEREPLGAQAGGAHEGGAAAGGRAVLAAAVGEQTARAWQRGEPRRQLGGGQRAGAWQVPGGVLGGGAEVEQPDAAAGERALQLVDCQG